MIVRLCALTLLLSVGAGFAPPAVARRPTRLGAVDAEWTDRRFGAARDQLDAWMERALRIRCPFFRRRATDVVESGGRVLSFVLEQPSVVGSGSEGGSSGGASGSSGNSQVQSASTRVANPHSCPDTDPHP